MVPSIITILTKTATAPTVSLAMLLANSTNALPFDSGFETIVELWIKYNAPLFYGTTVVAKTYHCIFICCESTIPFGTYCTSKISTIIIKWNIELFFNIRLELLKL